MRPQLLKQDRVTTPAGQYLTLELWRKSAMEYEITLGSTILCHETTEWEAHETYAQTVRWAASLNCPPD